jgi:hypothetical protein
MDARFLQANVEERVLGLCLCVLKLHCPEGQCRCCSIELCWVVLSLASFILLTYVGGVVVACMWCERVMREGDERLICLVGWIRRVVVMWWSWQGDATCMF